MFQKPAFGYTTTNSGAFGQPQQTATGTAHVKYNPVIGTDAVVKHGVSQNVNIKYQYITGMKEYENKSIEELRLEDYVAGRKGSTSGVFGGFQPTTENKPLFGGTTSFAQPATTSAPSVFGSGFGQTSSLSQGGSTSQLSFGAPAAPGTSTATGFFGAFGSAPNTAFAQPATTSAPSVFGSGFGQTSSLSRGGSTSQLSFGAPAAPGTSTATGLFGANKPAFGSAPNTAFAQPATTSAPTVFGSGFGQTSSLSQGVSTSQLSFGAPAAPGTSTATGLFGANKPAFGFAPNTGNFNSRSDENRPRLTFGTTQTNSSTQNDSGIAYTVSTNLAFGIIVKNTLSSMTNEKKLECMQDIIAILREFSVTPDAKSRVLKV